MADTRKPCCRPEAGNLERISIARATRVMTSSNGRLPVQGTETCFRCKRCGARHYELILEPGHYNTKGASI